MKTIEDKLDELMDLIRDVKATMDKLQYMTLGATAIISIVGSFVMDQVLRH